MSRRQPWVRRPFPFPGPHYLVADRVDYVSYSYCVSVDQMKSFKAGALALLRLERKVGVVAMRELAGWGRALRLRRINVEREEPYDLLKVTLIAEAYRVG